MKIAVAAAVLFHAFSSTSSGAVLLSEEFATSGALHNSAVDVFVSGAGATGVWAANGAFNQSSGNLALTTTGNGGASFSASTTFPTSGVVSSGQIYTYSLTLSSLSFSGSGGGFDLSFGLYQSVSGVATDLTAAPGISFNLNKSLIASAISGGVAVGGTVVISPASIFSITFAEQTTGSWNVKWSVDDTEIASVSSVATSVLNSYRYVAVGGTRSGNSNVSASIGSVGVQAVSGIPEPGSALAGLLLGAGLIRRKRR